mgnify:FL=1
MRGEYHYLNLIFDVLSNGVKESRRNGNVLTKIGGMMKFSLENNKLPLITTKKLAWKSCLHELIWFKNGETTTDSLLKNNVKIWDGNSSKEFLDSRNLKDYREGELGPIYGYQWRNWNKMYTNLNNSMYDINSNNGIDQLQCIIDSLKDREKRKSRRLIMSAWNPEQLDEMALPPCHILCQFHVTNYDELSCSLYQRSGDVGLGIPFNIASYSFLTHILAKHCDLKAKEFIHFIGNAHIYDDHVDALKEQITRTPYDFPTIEVNKRNNIDDYEFSDIIVNDYIHHDPIKMEMRV